MRFTTVSCSLLLAGFIVVPANSLVYPVTAPGSQPWQLSDGMPLPPPHAIELADGMPLPPPHEAVETADGMPLPPPHAFEIADGMPLPPPHSLADTTLSA